GEGGEGGGGRAGDGGRAGGRPSVRPPVPPRRRLAPAPSHGGHPRASAARGGVPRAGRAWTGVPRGDGAARTRACAPGIRPEPFRPVAALQLRDGGHVSRPRAVTRAIPHKTDAAL